MVTCSDQASAQNNANCGSFVWSAAWSWHLYIVRKFIYIHANDYKRQTTLVWKQSAPYRLGFTLKRNELSNDKSLAQKSFRLVRKNECIGELTQPQRSTVLAENEIKKKRNKMETKRQIVIVTVWENIQKANERARAHTSIMSWEMAYDIRWILPRWKDRNRFTLFTAFASLPVETDGKSALLRASFDDWKLKIKMETKCTSNAIRTRTWRIRSTTFDTQF